MIFNKKPKLKLLCDEAYVATLFPPLPLKTYFATQRKQLASETNKRREELRKRLKTDKKPHQTSAHLCSGLVGLLDTCWIIRCPSDIKITTNGDMQSYEYETPIPYPPQNPAVSCFPREAWADHIKGFPENTLKSVLKINSMWSAVIPKGYELYFLPLDIIGENRFSVFAGPLDSSGDVPFPIFPILYWHRTNSTEVIEAGSPLCLIKLVKKGLGETVEVREMTAREKEVKDSHQRGLCCSWIGQRASRFKNFAK